MHYYTCEKSLCYNSYTGSSVAIITAMDADSGDFGKITYLLDRLSSQVSPIHHDYLHVHQHFSTERVKFFYHDSFQEKFTIDTNNGVLKVADTLDREQSSTYNLIVEAWDNYQFGYVSGESRNAFKQIM